MAETRFGLFGTGGCARSIMPFVTEALNAALGDRAKGLTIVFVDREAGPDVNGIPVVAEEAFLNDDAERFFNVGIADPGVRQNVVERAQAAGAKAVTLIAHTAQVFPSSRIGEGCILCPSTIVTANAELGRFVHLNLFSYVEHDCRIGNYVTFAPGVHCNGMVEVGDAAYLGSGAILRQGRDGRPMRIGAQSVVGMGAVVTRDVAPRVTVVGNPARPLMNKRDREV